MSKEAGTPAETVEKQKSTLTKILSTCYSSVMISIRPFLFSLTLSAVLMAGEIGSMNRVIVIPVPNGGEAADARITADGTIYLLYNSCDIPYYAKSTDNGGTFSAPIPAVENAARKPDLVVGASA